VGFGRFIDSIRNGAPHPDGQLNAAEPHGGSTQVGAVPLAGVPGGSAAPSEDEQVALALDGLRAAVRRAGRELPGVLTSQLRQIDDLLRTTVATVVSQGASTEQRVLLAAMISDYIPTPLRAYLALTEHDRSDDSRATLMFSGQLAVLEETIHDLLNQIRIGAIAELSTHGRFLADKFSGPDAGLVLGGR
jgi:signal transduction histidine kinase